MRKQLRPFFISEPAHNILERYADAHEMKISGLTRIIIHEWCTMIDEFMELDEKKKHEILKPIIIRVYGTDLLVENKRLRAIIEDLKKEK